MPRLAILLLSVILCSCGSVPLATMFKLSSLENSDIAKIKPNELRVRLTLDDPIQLAKQSLRLQLKFEYANASNEEFEFQLEPVGEPQEISASSWLSSKELRRSYQFKLTRMAQLEFANFQRTLLEKNQVEKYFWTVFYYLAPHRESDAKVDVELKLSKEESFFYLLKQAKVKVSRKDVP